MSNIKLRRIHIFVLFSILLILGAVGPIAAQDDAITLRVWVLGNSGPGVEAAIPGFEAQYPNITVEFQQFGWNDLQPKLQAAFVSGEDLPDIVEVFSSDIPRFASSGVIVPLNDWLEPYSEDIASFAYVDSTDAEGNIYGLNWSLSPNLLFYRSDILEAEGIDPASLQTWDDLTAAGEQVTHDGQFMFLTASQSTQPQYFNYFTGMLAQLGGSPFDVNGAITINDDDRALKVLQTMEAIDRAEISLDVDAWWTPAFETAIKSGDLASFMTGSFHVNILPAVAPDAAGLWRIQLAPVIEGGNATGVFTGTGRGLVIPVQAEHSQEAWQFMEYVMLNEEGVQAVWEGGAILPLYKPSFDAAYWDEPVEYFGGQAVGRVLMDGLKELDNYQWFTGPIPGLVMANEVVGTQLRALMLNEIDAQAALDNILQGMQANMP